MSSATDNSLLPYAVDLYGVLLVVSVGIGQALHAKARASETRRIEAGANSYQALGEYLESWTWRYTAIVVMLVTLLLGFFGLTFHQYAAIFIGLVAGWRDAWSRKLALLAWLALLAAVTLAFVGIGTWLGPASADVLVTFAVPIQLVLTLRFFRPPQVCFQRRAAYPKQQYKPPEQSTSEKLGVKSPFAKQSSSSSSSSYSSSSSAYDYSSSYSSSSYDYSSSSSYDGGGGDFGGGGASSSW